MSMRRFALVALIALAVLLAFAVPAFAHTATPCNDSGEPGNSDYAQHHIVPQAQAGDLGPVDHDGDLLTHDPGSHRGFSTCS